jgi:hypothetical protein
MAVQARSIFEVVVYDGRMKVFRILNLNTGTVYSYDFETFEEATAGIVNGEERCGRIVKGTTLSRICDLLETMNE